MRGEVIKGHLDLLLLAVLQAGPAHGYAVIERLRSSSNEGFDLPEGTVYPALHRLERGRVLASRWERVGGRKRRVYRLTSAGRRALAEQRVEWDAFTRAVGAVLEGGS